MLAFAAALSLGATATAQTVTLTSGNSPYMVDNSPGQTIRITSGTNAVELPAGQTWILGPGNTWDGALAITDENWGVAPGWGANNMTVGSSSFGGANTNAAIIQVDSGASLRFLGNQSLGWGPWFAMSNMIQAAGDVIFEGNSAHIIGNNSFLGNLTVMDGGSLNFGETWGAASQIAFGPNTNIYVQGSGFLYLKMPASYTSTVGGKIVADSGSTFELASGKLVVNGANTTANPFAGTFTLDAGAQLMIGDASHASAIFGDPNHTNGSGLSLAVTTVSGTASVLSGYGTIYATVNNSGIVIPGGSSGTLGTLTVSKYVQSGTGVLQVEVSPTGASKLNVLGSATLAGSMQIKLDAGNYGNSVFPILSAGSVSGSFSTVSTTGSVSGAIVALQSTSTGYNVVTEKASSSQVIGHMVTVNRNDIYAFTSSLYDMISASKAGGRGKITVWLTPTGRLDNIGRDGLGYGLSSFGVAGGAQYASTWQNAVFGLALAYDHASLDVKNESTKASANTLNFGAYGGVDLVHARLDGAVFYNTYDATTKRTLSSYGTAVGSPKGSGWGGTVQVSQGLFKDRIVPFVRGTFARVTQDSLSETGVTTFDLTYSAMHANTFVGDLGVRLNILPATSDNTLQATVAIRHDFSDPGETIKGSFASLSGSSFNYHWKGDSQNTLLVGANAGAVVMPNLTVFGRVGGEFSQFRRSLNVGIGAKYAL
jgi:hypothetical protein